MTHRKRGKKENAAIHAKGKGRPYKVGPLAEKDEPNFLAGDNPNALGGTRPLLGGTETIAKNKTPIRSGKHALRGNNRLLSGADE